MKLSKNFSLKELTRSGTALRLGIDNSPNDEQLVSLTALCCCILQPVREKFGRVMINSGLRVLDLNRAIKSGDNSQHVFGQAADFVAWSEDPFLADWTEQRPKIMATFLNGELVEGSLGAEGKIE